MEAVELANNLNSNLPEAIRSGGRLEYALNEYREIIRKVSGSDAEEIMS